MRYLKIVTLITALSLLLHLLNLNFPPSYYFDENYDAFTALSYLQGKNIWQPSHTPLNPPRAYQWAHPPLSPLLIAA